VNNHSPITPTPELVRDWARFQNHEDPEALWRRIATLAARWGADQELEACCLELVDGIGRFHAEFPSCLAKDIRAARRPKQPSLKEQALELLETYNTSGVMLTADQVDTICRALEGLND